jgi:hypothetical protein
MHVEGPGDPLDGRPAIKIDVDCADTNPLFLQGDNSYVGQLGVGASWYCYSWPNQSTTGTAAIATMLHRVSPGWTISGAARLPHPVQKYMRGVGGPGSDSSLMATARSQCPHNAIVDGKFPAVTTGFGTYVEPGSSLVGVSLVVTKYAKSSETDACYPSAWESPSSQVGLRDGVTAFRSASCVIGKPPRAIFYQYRPYEHVSSVHLPRINHHWCKIARLSTSHL